MGVDPKIVGQSAPRIDVVSKVTGQALFPGDLSEAGMLHMKILFAERRHARIGRLDTSRAEKCPGVAAAPTVRQRMNM